MEAVVIPEGVLVLKTRVRRLYLSWWTTHYCVGLLGVLAGTLLTALTSAGDQGLGLSESGISIQQFKSHAWLIGIVAAVCTSLVTFLGPIGKAERYWSAFHALDQACLEYEQGQIGVKKFLARVRSARAILRAGGNTDEHLSDAFKDVEKEAGNGDRSNPAEPKNAL